MCFSLVTALFLGWSVKKTSATTTTAQNKKKNNITTSAAAVTASTHYMRHKYEILCIVANCEHVWQTA